MDIKQFRYFVEAARCGNIQDAADTLFVSRQAVSKAIVQLEQELGYPLFYRTHGGVTLSEQGLSYYDQALALVQDFDTLTARMSHVANREKLRIAIPLTVHQHFYERLQAFSRLHEKTFDLQLIGRTDAVCHTLFENGAVDMAISHLTFSAGIDSGQTVAVSPIHIAMRKDHQLAAKACLKPEDFIGESMIFYMNGYKKCFWLDERTPPPSYALDDILLVYELVCQGRGLFPVPPLSMPGFAKDIVLVPYDGPDNMDYFTCAIAAHTQRSPRLQKACLQLREALRDPELS